MAATESSEPPTLPLCSSSPHCSFPASSHLELRKDAVESKYIWEGRPVVALVCLFSAISEIAPEGDINLMSFGSLSPPANRNAVALT